MRIDDASQALDQRDGQNESVSSESRRNRAVAAMSRLDERSGAAGYGRWTSWVGGYWNFLAGCVLLVAGIVTAILGNHAAIGLCVFGVIAVSVGLFIGPKYMIRRMFRRPIPPARQPN